MAGPGKNPRRTKKRGQLSDASNITASNTAGSRRKPAAKPGTLPSHGVLPKPRFSRQEVKVKVRGLLKLPFDLSDAQAESIIRLDQGFDMICLMGTSYGKSIIYESVAALNPDRVVIVICPLKALEYDQVEQAKAKGLTACALNEDTCHDTLSRRTLFREVRQQKYQLVYISPEMACTEHYAELMNNEAFQDLVKVTVVDEAHVIAEWGESFRKAYSELCRLRSFTGDRVPFAAFSATLTTESFSVLWDALGFGGRPFWGIDTGVLRENLTYIIKRREKQPVPCMNALSIIPPDLDASSTADSVPKSIFYLERQADCIEATRTIRRCLPPQLRPSAVRPYSSIASAEAKAQIWDDFQTGKCRTLCATDAAGMGCNVRDVEYCAIFDIKGSSADSHLTLPRLSQRWGRTGRDKGIHGICVLFVPEWAFRPLPPPAVINPAVVRVKSGGKPKKERLEPAQWTAWRDSLPDDVEQLINLGHPTSEERTCIHIYFARRFRPRTGLTVYTTLDMTDAPTRGWRSAKLSYPATWIVLDVATPPSSSTCCSICNPELLKLINGVSLDSNVFQKFARDFLRPMPGASNVPPGADGSTSAAPAGAPTTPSRAGHLRGSQRRTVTKDNVSKLGDALRTWRRQYSDTHGGPFTTARDILPDSVLKLLLERADVLANAVGLTGELLARPVSWEMATKEEADGACAVVVDWAEQLPKAPAIARTPQKTPASQHRAEKRARTDETPSRENRAPQEEAVASPRPFPETPTRPRTLFRQDPVPETRLRPSSMIPPPPYAIGSSLPTPGQIYHPMYHSSALAMHPHTATPMSTSLPPGFSPYSLAQPLAPDMRRTSGLPPQGPSSWCPVPPHPRYPRITVPTSSSVPQNIGTDGRISRLAMRGTEFPLPLPFPGPPGPFPLSGFQQTPPRTPVPHQTYQQAYYPTPSSDFRPRNVDYAQYFSPSGNTRPL